MGGFLIRLLTIFIFIHVFIIVLRAHLIPVVINVLVLETFVIIIFIVIIYAAKRSTSAT
jgi:hypothetical protein